MSESTSGLWHVNPETGVSSKCRAKTPESCRWAASTGGLGHFQSKREADAAYEAYIASTADSKTTALSKMDHGAGTHVDTGDAGSTTAPVFERVSTLLTARVPLRTDREGRVPTLEPGDDSVKAQAKLASYLWKNFDGGWIAVADCPQKSWLRRVRLSSQRSSSTGAVCRTGWVALR